MNAAALLEAEAATRPEAVDAHDLALERGDGAHLWDAEGNRYLDFGANRGAANLGHGHPRVVEAIRDQARRLTVANQAYPNGRRAAYLDALLEVAPDPLESAALVNSGAEAVEVGLKFAVASAGGDEVVAFRNGFHGRTTGALACTWRPEAREPFEALLPDVTFAGYGDLEEAKEAVGSGTAAVVVEPVQGEGGVRLPPDGFLQGLRDLADDAGARLVVDEVQTGFGRTGEMWGLDHAGVTPDVLCLAKSAAGGVPMGATLLAPEVADAPAGSHGSTFGGNPLACAAAAAALDVVLEEDLPARARRLGRRLVDGLRDHDARLVREVRGLGLMVALELRVRVTPFLRGLRDRGVLALSSGATIARFLPPLVVDEDQVDAAVDAAGEALSEVAP